MAVMIMSNETDRVGCKHTLEWNMMMHGLKGFSSYVIEHASHFLNASGSRAMLSIQRAWESLC